MKKSIKQLVIVICFSLIFTTITIPIANAKESSNDVSSEQVNVEAQIMKRTLEPLLELIDQMPEDVAEQGINSGVEWLNVHKGNEFEGYEFVADGENLTAVKTVQESIGPFYAYYYMKQTYFSMNYANRALKIFREYEEYAVQTVRCQFIVAGNLIDS